MGNYELLKAAINDVIKANGRQEITGEVLNQVLLSMVNSLGVGYQCMGVATPSTNPGTPDQNVFYFATQAGTYTNFDAIVLQAGISVLIWDGDWASQTWFTVDSTPTNNSQNLIASGAVFNALKLDGGAYDVSAHNSGATFASLSALLNSANLNTLIPTEIRHGGMSIKFVLSSDNKYVQFRCVADEFTTDVTQWQGVDEKPIHRSKNLLESGGAYNEILSLKEKIGSYNLSQEDFEIGLLAINSANNTIKYTANSGFIRTKQNTTIHLPACNIAMVDAQVRIIKSVNGTLTLITDFHNTSIFSVTEGDYYLSFKNTGSAATDVNVMLQNITIVANGSLEKTVNNVVDNVQKIYNKVGAEEKGSVVLDTWVKVPISAKQGELLNIVTSGTAVVSGSAINIRYDDQTTSATTMANNAKKQITASRNTSCFYIRCNSANIVTAGTISISISTGSVFSTADDIKGLDPAKSNSNVFIDSKPFYLFPEYSKYYLDSTGTLKQSENYNVSDYISIRGMQSITLIDYALSGEACYIVYDIYKNIIQTISESSNNSTVTLNKNAHYIRCSFVANKNYFIPNSSVTNKELSKRVEYTSKFLYAANTNILSNITYHLHGFYKSDGTVKIDNSTSYKYSDLIPIGRGTYSYNGTISGAACICLFDKDKRFVSTVPSSSFSSITITSDNIRYIGISTNSSPSLVCQNDVYNNIVANFIHETYKKENDFITRNQNVLNIEYGELECNTFRLFFRFKINHYAELSGDKPIISFGDVTIGLKGEGNTENTVSDWLIPNFVTKYPLPHRNTRFYITQGNVTKSCAHRTLPEYKEIIGEDLFSIKYVGSASEYNYDIDNANVQTEYESLADKMYLSYTDNTLVVSDGTTEYINVDVSSFNNIGALVAYLQNTYSDFEFKLLCNSYTAISNIAPITKVYLVSHYQKINRENSTLRADAFPCYFNHKIDKSVHTVEIVCNKGVLYWVVDGLTETTKTRFYINDGKIREIICGSNTANQEIEVLDFELNVGHIGDAEPLADGRIISKYNPSIVVLEGHGMYIGDECDGKNPVFMDETPASNEAAVVPVKYRSSYYEMLPSLTNIAMSDKRFNRLCNAANDKNYTHINIGDCSRFNDDKLPKRRWGLCFDDRHHYFFTDLEINSVFGRNNVPPTFATSFSLEDSNSADYYRRQQKIDNAGWETVNHGLNDINVSCMSSTQIYDMTSTDTSKNRTFSVQRLTAENAGINWTVWVYSNGAANANTIKAFQRLGVKLGFMTSGNVPITYASNPLYLYRTNASDHTDFSYVIQRFV